MKTVTVNAKALSDLLDALNGPAYYIRELQATRGSLTGDGNPINVLVEDWNRNVDEHNEEAKDA
jgi:hypothetical protein